MAKAANLQLQDNQKVPYTLTAVDVDGNAAVAAAGSTIAVNSSDLAMATIVPDATPAAGSIASGFIVGGAKLGTVQVSAQETKADGTAGLSGAASIDIVASAATAFSFALGTPVAQP